MHRATDVSLNDRLNGVRSVPRRRSDATWAWLPLLVACAGGCSRGEERSTAQAALTVPVPAVGQFSVLASRALTVGDRVQMTGGSLGVAASATATPNTLTVGMDSRAGVGQVLLAQRVVLMDRAATGELGANQITAPASATSGPRSAFLAPPVAPVPGAVTAGTTVVTVNAGQTMTLAAGQFAAVTVNGTLSLTGGLYQMQSLRLGADAHLTARARSTVRIATGLTAGDRAVIAPAAPLRAADLHLTAAGTVDTANNSILFGMDGQVTAVIVARNAFRSGDRLVAAGAIAAQDVIVGNDSKVAFDGGFGCGSAASCDDGNACTTDACVDASCASSNVANGTTCSDGNACTRADSCQAGLCVGANPVTCAPSDQCHAAGVCSAATGVCSNPTLANGTICSDGNACTRADSCQTGLCVGASPVSCAPADQCHAAGVCNATTGVCANAALPNGTACSDGNACTRADSCQAGLCVGANPVSCAPADQCHAAGVCDVATGVCANAALPDGTACSDGNACTRADSCQAGLCVGANPVSCAPADQCHAAGICNAATGVCANAALADGTACSDGNACSQGETCQAGACAGGSAVICAASDQCHQAGTCDPTSGGCTNPNRPDGTACDDRDVCTQAERCQAGRCAGGTPLITEIAAGVPQPMAMVPGTDGNLWFISPQSAPETFDGAVVRLVPSSGVVTPFPSGKALVDLTPGYGDDFWFAERLADPADLSGIGHLTTAGLYLPDVVGIPADRVSVGADGQTIWFTSAQDGFNLIGSITVADWLLNNILLINNSGRSLTAGPDGNMWLTESDGGADPALIGRVSATGALTEFPVATPGDLNVITGGPDGNLWFTDAGQNEIGRITPAGIITKFAVPTPASGLFGIVTGPDGNLWFTEGAANRVGRITPAGVVTELACIPTASSGPSSIAAGSDGRLWFTETASGKLGAVRIP